MTEESSEVETGWSFTDNISLAWRGVDDQPGEDHLALVSESNEGFLRTVSVIGDFSRENSEDAPESSQEFARLDAKLNLLLGLVSQLIYQQSGIPGTSEVTLSSNEIQWSGDSVPAPGQTVFLEVYVQRGTPKPLCFYGTVVSDDSDYAQGRARVRYLGLGASAQAWLDKLIFRHHRRTVAYKRAASSGN